MSARRLKALLDSAAAALGIGLLDVLEHTDRKRAANFGAALLRYGGPLTKEHRIGRDNLRAAFPEKSDAEIEQILTGVWDNLGRVGAEFAHLDDFHIEGIGPPAPDGITYEPETVERHHRLLKSERPAIAFAAHLANWEVPALCAKLMGLNSAVLYRRPNLKTVSDLIVKRRTPLMGQLIATGFDAPVRLARLLQSGVHVGLLADQHYTKGVEVTFFGRRCLANPLVALLARQTECPIYGTRVVRLADGNSFWGELTDEIAPTRDAEGRIDVKRTTQTITSVIEGWVREHPEQWLWLHRRWR